MNQDDLKHQLPLLKELAMKEPQHPTTLIQYLSLLLSYMTAFECLYKLLLIAVTLPVPSASWERIFQK